MRTKALLLLLIGTLYSSLNGQQISFEKISSADGLSQNSVISITQDSLGFLWFATQDGLNKYDGSHFLQYEVFFKDKTEANNNQLGKLKADSKDRIWMTTLDGGLQYCDPITDQFVFLKDVPEASYIHEDTKGQIWVSSFTEGLFLLTEKEDGQFTTDQKIVYKSISKIIQDGNQLLLITKQGIIKYDPDTQSYESFLEGLTNITDLSPYGEGSWLVSTFGDGLFRSTGLINMVPFDGLSGDLFIQDIFQDTKNRIWLATYGDGVFLIEQNTISQYTHNDLDENSINYNDILTIFEDKEENIWFGSDGGGASYLLNDRKLIYCISNSDMPKNIPVDVPRAISKDNQGKLWIGTSGKGLTVVSENLDSAIHYQHFDNDPTSISSNRVMSLYHDDVQNLWIGTQGGGLNFRPYNKNTFIKIDAGLPGNTIWDIHPANENELWLCTRKEGLFLINKNTYRWRKPTNTQKFDELITGNIRVIISGDDGSFFVGTEAGNVYHIGKDEKVEKLVLNGGISGAIKTLYLDDNHLWIGTIQSGIIIYNIDTQKYSLVNKSYGLPNNVVYSILPQNEKYVWISTNMGLCQINKRNAYDGNANVVNQRLTVDNGLVSNEFNTGAYYQDEERNMYFGGIAGINWFDPNEILKSNTPIDIILLDLITTDQDGREVKHISNLESIDLNHKDKNFQVSYVARNYARTKPEYKYKLEGINAEWVSNDNNELVSFSNIPPGSYSLYLNATNNDGVWNSNPVKFDINIIPAFWQTWWFKVLTILGCLLLLWLIYHIRVKELKRTTELKQQLKRVEAKALKLQMNPHFLFNSLNAIDNYILKNEKIKASDYLSKFSKLVRQILDYSELSYINLAQELNTLELYINMEQLRFNEKFDYKIIVHDNVDIHKMQVPPLILQPYAENAIWHGLMHLEEGGKLKIEIMRNGKSIKCLIDDNGIGRARAAEINSKSATKHKSYGMRITEKRLSLNNDLNKIDASIDVIDKMHDNGNSAGTKVEINFPIKAG